MKTSTVVMLQCTQDVQKDFNELASDTGKIYNKS